MLSFSIKVIYTLVQKNYYFQITCVIGKLDRIYGTNIKPQYLPNKVERIINMKKSSGYPEVHVWPINILKISWQIQKLCPKIILNRESSIEKQLGSEVIIIPEMFWKS